MFINNHSNHTFLVTKRIVQSIMMHMRINHNVNLLHLVMSHVLICELCRYVAVSKYRMHCVTLGAFEAI